MRMAAYAGTSMVLATGVILRAFHQRANFYSASVYLAQSNACLMILTNLLLLVVCTLMLGLRRLLYGSLRPIEVEQLYEKAWFAITETCLAMTIFREEVGGWFLVMFVGLLAGKVWGWIGEGRVEILEQQPPANPRLFHARLSFSLLLSLTFDFWVLGFSIRTVLRQARPNMMVMFAFEFAVLSISSTSTAARYAISLYEAAMIKQQTEQKVEERRAEIRRERDRSRQSQEPESSVNSNTDSHLPSGLDNTDEIEIDESEIDVVGWQNKGQWVFALELTTDFLKLVVYSVFFTILLTFYGLPIHILRDVFLTFRSFSKRINDYVKYRQATKDMNERYPDATSEEIAREDTCIICREEMQAWATNPANNAQADGARLQNAVLDERSRPKKLPCGHILHFGCLRSWLERQQNCPTCRQPVITPNRIRIEVNRAAQAPRPPNHNIAHHHLHHHHEQRHQHVHRPIDHGLPAQAPVNQARYVRFGPLQLGFAFGRDRAAAVNPNGIENPPRPAGQQPDSNGNTNLPGPSPNGRQDIGGDQTVSARFTGQVAIQNHINEVEQLLSQELNTLRNTAEQLQTARALQNEIHRLQHQSSSLQTQEATSQAGLEAYQGFPAPSFVPPPVHQNLFRPLNHHHHVHPTFPQMGTGNVMSAMGALPQNQAFRAPSGQRPLTSSDANLPPGFALPDGWTLLPLQQNNIRVESSPPSSTVTWQVPTPRSATAPPLEPTGESIQEPQRDEPSTQNPHLQTWQEMANQAEAYQRLLRPENASNIARGGNASPNTQSGLGTLPNSHDPVQPSPLRQQNSLPPQSSSLPPMPSTRSVPLGPTVSATPGSNEGQESDHTPSSTAPALHDSTAESSKHVTNSSLSAHRRGPLQDTPEETQNGTIATDKGKGRAATVEDVPEELD